MNVNQVVQKIKEVKIQGAENIALAALQAYSLSPTEETINKLINARPTEPALRNALNFAKHKSVNQALEHFSLSKLQIAKLGSKLIHGIVFTHCHSSTVINILKEAKKQNKHFQVFNTETRPLYQGRKTSHELEKAGIKVTMIIDSAAGDILDKIPVLPQANLMIIGADAVLQDGSVINKIGSRMFAELANKHKIPVYIATDSWKFTNRPVKIEERSFKEVWESAKNIKIRNPAFEIVPAKYITKIISELGILTPKEFTKKVKKTYPFITKK